MGEASKRNVKRLKELENNQTGIPFWDKLRTADDWEGIFSLLHEKRRYKKMWELLFDYIAFTVIPDLDKLKTKTWNAKTSMAIRKISESLKDYISDITDETLTKTGGKK